MVFRTADCKSVGIKIVRWIPGKSDSSTTHGRAVVELVYTNMARRVSVKAVGRLKSERSHIAGSNPVSSKRVPPSEEQDTMSSNMCRLPGYRGIR